MIKQFNFYDVYGYLLPGLLLCTLLYAPFGWMRQEWPSSDLGSAALAVALAYVIGHLIPAFCGANCAGQATARSVKGVRTLSVEFNARCDG